MFDPELVEEGVAILGARVGPVTIEDITRLSVLFELGRLRESPASSMSPAATAKNTPGKRSDHSSPTRT